MKKQTKNIFDLITRYIILVLIAFPNLFIFYFIFTPITVYAIYFLLNIFFQVTLSGNMIGTDCFSIKIIDACVAGSAYYLLFVLNFSTSKINLKKRINILASSFAIFLTANVLRIFFLAILASYGSSYFDQAHLFFWYFVSVFLVVGIWFFEVKYFKIKQIPFYSDIKSVIKLSS